MSLGNDEFRGQPGVSAPYTLLPSPPPPPSLPQDGLFICLV